MSKLEVFVTEIRPDGKQYVGVVDGQIRRLHYSSSDTWAKNDDIVPTMVKDFGDTPELYFDSVNQEISDKLAELRVGYNTYKETHGHLTMNDYLDLVATPVLGGENDE